MDPISSTQNPKIKELLKLEKAGFRKKTGLFIIEGFREIDRAVRSGYIIDKLFYNQELVSEKYASFVEQAESSIKIPVSKNVFSRIAYRDNHDGLLAVSQMKDHPLTALNPKSNSLYLVIEQVEKPGNLGAILRTADAASVDAVIICDSQTDIYNPNTVRASLGTLFSNELVLCSSEEAIDFLKDNNFKIFAAALQNSSEYFQEDFTESTAIVLGSEANGLTNKWRENADRIIRIPMKGMADSLNVSVTAAILCFEAVRQKRNLKN
jgi:TrmH family RNA methyltransferase